MFTDIAGFTPLAQADEGGALGLLREQEELVGPILEAHRGRKVKSIGDGLLIEFPNALDAVECGVDLQRHIHERNAREGTRPLRVRVGIHLGDVQGIGTDIFGDAVNIASRVEPLADPGGVCLSEPVYVQVHNKVPYQLEKLGSKSLKGVRESIEIYGVVLPWNLPEVRLEKSGPTRLAVLPFANISPDPHDEYFADGLTEELITVLSKLRELRVIARTSVSQYKATSKSVAQIGAELGVDAVLEGSVRKAGDQLRITVQLIDVGTQEHTWADTFDRRLDNVFAVQAEIAKQVAEQLKVNVKTSDEARLSSRPSVRAESYLAYLKGRTLLHSGTREATKTAREQFELAISLDPNNAAAHSAWADLTHNTGWSDLGLTRVTWDEMVRRSVARAIEIDPNLAEAHASLGLILWDDFEYVAAEKELKLALAINPSCSVAHDIYAALLEDEARADEALLEFALAEATDPLSRPGLFAELLIWLGRWDEALLKIEKVRKLDGTSLSYHADRAWYFLARSDLDECLKEIRLYSEIQENPRWKAVAGVWACVVSGDKEQARALLRYEATLPEYPPTDWAVAYLYAELGDLDQCFPLLEKMVSEHFISFQRWRLDPRLENVRRDTRFAQILKKMNLA